jgi:hypothetical protein
MLKKGEVSQEILPSADNRMAGQIWWWSVRLNQQGSEEQFSFPKDDNHQIAVYLPRVHFCANKYTTGCFYSFTRIKSWMQINSPERLD